MPIPPLVSRHYSKGWKQKSFSSDRRHSPKKRKWSVLRSLLVVSLLALAAGAISFAGVLAWFTKDLPDPNRIAKRSVEQSTKIFDRTGTISLYEIHGEERRTVVPIEEIPESMKWATISIEDQQFYSHKGVNLRGIARAILANLTRGPKSQGGSSITQQFIKNAILGSEKTYTRKLKEFVLAWQIERRFSKDQILQLYLNEIPYGSNAYGVEAAALTFFGKGARELTVAEGALLAALPQAPTYYSPYGSHREELFARQHHILDLMVKEEYLQEEEVVKAKKEKLDFKKRAEQIIAPHFVFYIKELLTQRYGERMVEQGGLRVTTTIDVDKQKIAEEVVQERGEKNTRYKATNAALVAIDTKTGQILTMVGSRDYFNEEIDGNVNVTIRPRQPGSSLKPIVYATAFAQGYTPETMIFDFKTDFGNNYSPSNYDLTEHGPVSMRKALAGSLNIPAVKTLYLAGINNVLDTAQAMGYTTLGDRSRFGLSLVLGGAEVKLLEHTSAYAVFAREGVRYPTTAILKVQDQRGKIMEEWTPSKGQVVIDRAVAQKITSILTDNSARAFIFGSQNHLTLPDRPVAAKTGTTNDFRDAWILGYTPSIAVGVWVGNNNNSPMSRGADGSVVAAPIWQIFLRRVLSGTPVETFHAPPKETIEKPILRGEIDILKTLKVDQFTKKRIPASCLERWPKEFVVEKTIKETHSILHFVDRENPRGLEPKDPSRDPLYLAWEKPVELWAKNHGYTQELGEEENCELRSLEAQPSITILNPEPNTTFNRQNFDIKITVSSGKERSLVRVDYLIDKIIVESVQKNPFQTSYQPKNLTDGPHRLIVRVYDDVENVAEDSVNFIFLSETSPSSGEAIIEPTSETP